MYGAINPFESVYNKAYRYARDIKGLAGGAAGAFAGLYVRAYKQNATVSHEGVWDTVGEQILAGA